MSLSSRASPFGGNYGWQNVFLVLKQQQKNEKLKNKETKKQYLLTSVPT